MKQKGAGDRGQGAGDKGQGTGRLKAHFSPVVIVVGLPGCLLAAASVVALALAAIDQPPMWPHETYTLSEAAGARDEAEVVRLIERGQDPNSRYSVRAGLVLERTARLTPLEAAVLNDDPAITRQLLARGVRLDDTSWAAIRCQAGSRAAAVLDEIRLSAGLDCAGIKTPWD
jgi:hypothetical protein